MRMLFAMAIAALSTVSQAWAYEFMEKRECELHFPRRPAVHTTCVVDGGMSNGSIDVAVTTPDGNKHMLFGYLAKIDGWLLDQHKARQTSERLGEFPFCVKSVSGDLELCLMHKIQ